MSFPERLSSLSGTREEVKTPKREDSPDGSSLVQRCVIIQRDEKGYGLTVSGDNPVFVQSVKADGAAARAGVQQHDRIIKVNGTLVTSRNHIDVVKLIKSGSYVALTLLGKPPPTGPPGSAVKHQSFRDSAGGRITAPQPVDPEKDRQLWQQKVHTMQAMYEQAKDDYEKIQKAFLKHSSEKLHAQLIDKEKTVKKLETELKQLGGTVVLDSMTPGPSPGHPSVSDPDSMDPTPSSWQQGLMSRGGASRHQKQASVPVSLYKSTETKETHRTTQVSRSKSDVTSRRVVSQSSHIMGFSSSFHRENLSEAASVPIGGSDGGSVSDSPHTSPSISPTPTHPSNCNADDANGSGRGDSSTEDGVIPASQQNIITIDDEDINSEEEQLEGPKQWTQRSTSPLLSRLQALEGGDPGPFANITTLEKRPAHLGIFLHYLISNSDPSCLFFYVVADMYSHAQGSVKDLRKWAYEIYSTFLVHKAPLKVELDSSIVTTIDCVLAQSANENSMRSIFDQAKTAVKSDIAELLTDFCSKKDLGLGGIYGVHELDEVMDKNKEHKLIDKYLSPHLERCTKDNVKLGDRDQAIGWALATFLRYVGVTKIPSIDRTQSFVMKDKRVIKLPGKSNKTKQFRGHVFNLTHYTTTTFCTQCSGLIWGVGTQGFQCQVCEINVHRQCSEDVEQCGGKQKKDKKRPMSVIPMVPTFGGRKQSNPRDSGQDQVKEIPGDAKPELNIITQPAKRDDEPDYSGLPAGHGVKSIIERYESPQSPTDGVDSAVVANVGRDRELGRSESMKGRGEVTKAKKNDRPARRAKSDVEMDDNTIKSLNQSGSSSTSSLSNRSVESPLNSSETNVNEIIAADSDLDVEAELPSLKSILGEDTVKKLKPKEKKRQEVLNELMYTERSHLRSLKILDQLFYRPMINQQEGTHFDLARSLFPNLKQMIELHKEMNSQMKKRRQDNPVIPKVGDILLSRFDGQNGEIFRQACAEYCRNQTHALEMLKKHQRKEQRLSQFLNEAESSPLCRRLQLKDLMPVQMQRLTKYPLLIDNLMKYTQASSEEHCLLQTARERSKQILAFVNQAVTDCENFHRLRNLQKKLDKRPIENLANHHSYEEMKNLELTQHKLVYDGNLSMKLRTHRMMDVHVVLLEDIMVLLQKTDDKLVLCQSVGQSRGGADDRDKYVNTHSPLLKLQNLLARNVATDKKAFFVVNTENSGPQIYEFVAPTQDERKKWMKYINDSVESVKQSKGFKTNTFVPPIATPPVPIAAPPGSVESDTISLRREQITRVSTTPPPHEAARPHVQIGSETADMSQTSESAFVQPDEVHISGPVVGQAEQVLTPIEKLRRNDDSLEATLEERKKIIDEIHGTSQDESRVGGEVDGLDEAAEGSVNLITLLQEISREFTQLVKNSSSHEALLASSPTTQTPHSGAAKAEPPKVTIPIPMTQLRDMATRMNQILTKLLSTVNNEDEEKEGLREELRQAQEKLDSLKQIQRAVMGGTLPPSPQSRPASIISAGSSNNEDSPGDLEGGAAQVPSVHEVADSLREQAQEVMNAVGLTQQEEDPGMKTPTPQTPSKSPFSSSTGPQFSSESQGQVAKVPESDSEPEYEEIPNDITPPAVQEIPVQHIPSNNNVYDDSLNPFREENSKNEILMANEQFVDKLEIESVMSQEMMSSTLTTDLDEGANDSDSDVTMTTVPNLGDLGETDTDSVQKLEGVVLPGGISSEELLEDETKTSTSDSAVTSSPRDSESNADPIEI